MSKKRFCLPSRLSPEGSQQAQPETPTAPVTPEPSINGKDKIEIAASDQTELRALETLILQAKLAVSDRYLELNTANALVVQRQQDFLNAVIRVARVCGIDIDSNKECWNLDTQTMIFHRMK